MGFIFDFGTVKWIKKIQRMCEAIVDEELYKKNEANYVTIDKITFDMAMEADVMEDGYAAVSEVVVEGSAGRCSYDRVYNGKVDHVNGEHFRFKFGFPLDAEEEAVKEIIKREFLRAMDDAEGE